MRTMGSLVRVDWDQPEWWEFLFVAMGVVASLTYCPCGRLFGAVFV